MDWTWIGRGLRIGGHRGAPDAAPENTFAGFEAAYAAGVEYLETDVHWSAGGIAVVIHDETLNRTTDGRGMVAEKTLAELRTLDAGRRFSAQFTGERIPTLEEFLRWIEARPPIGAVIEAKARDTGAEIARQIGRSPAHERLAVCTFLPDEIRGAKAALPEVPCVLLFHRYRPPGDPLDHIRACGADGADVPWQWDDGALVDRMHAAGMIVGGGTANDARAVKRLIALGADFVDSDRPATAVRLRNEISGTT